MIRSRSFTPRSRALRRFAKGRRRAFTILEMLVALAVFMVLLAAVFVPIKLAGDLSGVGIARASAQQAGIDGIRQIKSDITKAIVILPNERTNGITDVYPYTLNLGYPYRRNKLGYKVPSAKDTSDGASTLDACQTTGTNQAVGAPNTARLDLILPANNTQGNLDPNIRNNNVLVTYYARRRDIRKAFDPIDNPVVLFRAQIPFQYVDATIGTQPFPAWGTLPSNPPTPPYNADLSNQRFSTLGASGCNARSLQWLTMNQYGEFDLTPLALPAANASPTSSTASVLTFGSHQLVLPRETALITPNAATDTTATPSNGMSLVPDTTFVCSDTNKDGKIDTVTIQLSVGQYDENSVNRRTVPSPTPGGPPGVAAPRSALQPQIARTLTETVFDPNVQ
ncbi:hypothetical protein IAD21_05221 [Abditibacteriota bacterium]|nr:hypothetical protein IAD21_05221 [Abditibacteriota bacterium]